MDELERRLRSALADMAEEVPPSHNAWAEQERRLALKSHGSRVRPALMAAVAAAVVALVAVPVTLLSLRSPSQVDHASMPTVNPNSPVSPTAPTEPSDANKTTFGPTWSDHGYREIPGEHLVLKPSYVTGAKEGGNLHVVAYLVSKDGNPNLLLCTAVLPESAEVNGPDQRGASFCREVPAQSKKLVRFQMLTPDSAEQGLYLFVADPKVSTILLRRGEDDRYTEAYQIGTAQTVVLLMGRMNSPLPPKQYSAKDANQQYIEHG
jgi:hypothetical protein